MNKQKYLIVFMVLLLGLGFSVFQYLKTFQTDFASATSTVSNPGHLWSSIECNSDSLCVDTVSNRLGIGTVSPSQKLEVNGSILTSGSGDVCNGAGKCLSSVFQTNVIVGTNPACPAGQKEIMKAYNGTWYTSAQVSSWSQVSCGQIMSSDGTPLLVNSAHTVKMCNDAGGTVVSDGNGNNMCRFNAAACPNTWLSYGWSATSPKTCSTNCSCSYCCGSCSTCTTPSHAWSNSTNVEQCSTCTYNTGSPCDYSCKGSGSAPCSANVSQVGCY